MKITLQKWQIFFSRVSCMVVNLSGEINVKSTKKSIFVRKCKIRPMEALNKIFKVQNRVQRQKLHR